MDNSGPPRLLGPVGLGRLRSGVGASIPMLLGRSCLVLQCLAEDGSAKFCRLVVDGRANILGGSVSVSKALIGWIVSLAGLALSLYGYFAIGHPPFIDWPHYAPWWISDYLRNIESEIGMLLMCVGSIFLMV
jgi:hypothetical protein